MIYKSFFLNLYNLNVEQNFGDSKVCVSVCLEYFHLHFTFRGPLFMNHSVKTRIEIK